MEVLRRPETAQGQLGFWESGNSDRSLTADERLAREAHRIRGERYFAVLFELFDLFSEARAEVDGEQIDVRAFARARKLLDTLPHGYAVPEVGMDPDGEISLDWIRSDRTMVSLSIGSRGDPTYAGHLRDGTAHGVIKLKEGFPAALSELLRRLYYPA